MLVLSRRVGERIVVGDDIIVTVVDIDGNKVRIGIEAPKTIAIRRDNCVNTQPKPPSASNRSAAGDAGEAA